MAEGERDRGTIEPGTTIIASPDERGDVVVRARRDEEAPESSPPPDRREPPDDEPAGRLSHGFADQLRDVARRDRGVSMAAVSLIILLAVAAVVSIGAAIWAILGEGRAREAEREAVKARKKAEEVATEYKGRYQRNEATWRATMEEASKARADADESRRAADEARDILDFLKKSLLSAGRPGDGSLSAAFWAAGKGRDVTLRRALDATEAGVAKEFNDRPLAEAAVREMLGLGYLNIGEDELAVKQYRLALDLREGTQGASHPDAAACRNQLAVAYRLSGHADEAARLFRRVPNSADHAEALAGRGRALLLENKPAEAEIKLRESLTIRREIQPGEWQTFETESILGQALLDQKKFADAEPLLLSGYEGLQRRADRIPPGEKGRVDRALERLMHLYEARGDREKATQWREKLQAARAPQKP